MEQLVWGFGGVAVTVLGVMGKVWVAKIRANGHRKYNGMRQECATEFKSLNGAVAQGNQAMSDHGRRLDKMEEKDDVVLKEVQTVALKLSREIGVVGERIARLEGPRR